MTFVQQVNRRFSRCPAWPLYIVSVFPPAWYLWLGMTGGLGIEPIKELEHRMGLLTLQVLILVLAITPIRNLTGLNLIRFRRALGLVGFFYIALHLLVWLVLDVQILSQIWADIVKRPYITIGMTAFVLLIPLAITSNDLSIRKLGPKRWKKVHKLFYIAAVLGAAHFVILSKGFRIEPLVYMAIVIGLLMMRFRFPVRRVAA